MNTVKTRIKTDDKVKIVAGKDKGKIGKVLKLDKKNNRVVIENVNVVKNHVKPSPANRQGGIVEKEAPIHLSNVMPVCGSCMKPVRIKSKTLEDGKKLRICSSCNEALDA